MQRLVTVSRRFALALGNLSWRAIILFGSTTIIVFGAAYFAITQVSPGNGVSVESPDFLTALYFSASAFVSQTYGEIVPLGLSRFLAVTEGLLGLFFLTILISKIVSARQETMITRMYHRSYIDFFKGVRDDIGEQRLILRDISSRLCQNPSDDQLHEEAAARFNRSHGSLFRSLASLIGGLGGFLAHEKMREEAALKELDIYHLERIMHTLWITIREAQSTIQRLSNCGFYLNTRGKGNLRLFLNDIERLSNWINDNYRSEEISDKNAGITEIAIALREWLNKSSDQQID